MLQSVGSQRVGHNSAQFISVQFSSSIMSDSLPPHELQHTKLPLYVEGIDLDYCNIERFALETNRDHSIIFEIAPKHCISDSPKIFLPTVVDIMFI